MYGVPNCDRSDAGPPLLLGLVAPPLLGLTAPVAMPSRSRARVPEGARCSTSPAERDHHQSRRHQREADLACLGCTECRAWVYLSRSGVKSAWTSGRSSMARSLSHWASIAFCTGGKSVVGPSGSASTEVRHPYLPASARIPVFTIRNRVLKKGASCTYARAVRSRQGSEAWLPPAPRPQPPPAASPA